MPRIKLIGELGLELERAGLKPGDEIDSTKGSELTGSMYFETYVNGRKFECVVWPENYELITVE